MKRHNPKIKTVIHTALVLIAIALVSTARAYTSPYGENTTDSGDINNDGLVDMAVVTSPITITIYLANPDGSYTLSDTLSTSKNRTITYIEVVDINGDGILDVYAISPFSEGYYLYRWLGNGDGSFVASTTSRWFSKKGGPFLGF